MSKQQVVAWDEFCTDFSDIFNHIPGVSDTIDYIIDVDTHLDDYNIQGNSSTHAGPQHSLSPAAAATTFWQAIRAKIEHRLTMKSQVNRSDSDCDRNHDHDIESEYISGSLAHVVLAPEELATGLVNFASDSESDSETVLNFNTSGLDMSWIISRHLSPDFTPPNSVLSSVKSCFKHAWTPMWNSNVRKRMVQQKRELKQQREDGRSSLRELHVYPGALVFQQYHQHIHSALLLLHTICHEQHVTSNSIQEQKQKKKALVVGAGPAGLLSALAAHRSGLQVTVVEKRTDYVRDIWFDMYPEPYYSTKLKLERLGIMYQHAVHLRQPENPSVVSLQAKTLELFLARVVRLLSIPVHYGTQFVTVCSNGVANRAHVVARPVHELSNLSSTAIDKMIEADSDATDRHSLWCNRSTITRLFNTSESMLHEHVMTMDFDILIGADGPSSRVRHTLDIPIFHARDFEPIDTSSHHPRAQTTLHVDNLQQITMIVNFRAVESLSSNDTRELICPEVRDNIPGTTEPLDPWYIAFELLPVSSVFKRFYKGSSSCHMQILFSESSGRGILKQSNEAHRRHRAQWTAEQTREAERMQQSRRILWTPKRSKNLQPTQQHSPFKNFGASVSEDERTFQLSPDQQSTIPWPLLLQVAHLYFVEPVNGIDALQDMIHRNSDGKFDITFFPVSIRVAQHLTTHIANSRSVAALVGDATFTAHYRLGVGINSAFDSMGDLTDLLITVATTSQSESITNAVQIREKNAQDRLRNVVQYQLSTMFYEAYCDFVVFFDTTKPTEDSQLLYYRLRPPERVTPQDSTSFPQSVRNRLAQERYRRVPESVAQLCEQTHAKVSQRSTKQIK
jgi:FAD binding domain